MVNFLHNTMGSRKRISLIGAVEKKTGIGKQYEGPISLGVVEWASHSTPENYTPSLGKKAEADKYLIFNLYTPLNI